MSFDSIELRYISDGCCLWLAVYQIISRVIENVVVVELYVRWDLLRNEGCIQTVHIALGRHRSSIESLAWLIVVLVALES